ncbi:ATP-grasp domain-containing protein [Micromonospora chokoriensis]
MTTSEPLQVPPSVTHVLVGYSSALLPVLDRLLPAGSVLVLEEPDLIAARGIEAAAAKQPCVAALLPAPIQDEQHPGRTIVRIARPRALRAVLPGVEYAVVTAAALADVWCRPGANLPAARRLRDKGLLRAAVIGAGIDQPEWEMVTGPEDVERFRARHGGRCVLKPANRQASVGVQLLESDTDVDVAWRHTAEADEPGLRRPYAGTSRYLVEQVLSGPEVSVEALVDNGAVRFLNVTGKRVQRSRYPVETGHVVPAPLPASVRTALQTATARLVSATGFGTGVLHAEWILQDSRPYLVECAARLPGDNIRELIDLAYGGNLLRDLLHLLEGKGVARSGDPTAAAAVRFLTAGTGTVTAVDGAENARRCPGVEKAMLHVGVGDTVVGTTNSWQRLGFVIARGRDAEDATSRVEAATTRITISTAERHL